MNLSEYQEGQKVKVFINNIKTTNLARPNEWRDGIVVRQQIVHPQHWEKHKPYTMLVVQFQRTYFSNENGYYDQITHEGFIHNEEVKLNE